MRLHNLAAIAAALVLAPALGWAQPGAVPAAEMAEALAVCSRITAVQVDARTGPELDGCWTAGLAAMDGAGALSVADQETVALGFVRALREVAGEPVAFGAAAPTVAIISELMSVSSYRECWSRSTYVTTLEGCSAAVRIITVTAQAIPPGNVEGVAVNICIASQAKSAWQPAILAIVDELIARAAAGGDPVMRERIDAVVAMRAQCTIVG